ncbi:hypothetical protein SARC_04468 [Sphaeroforma arctica JP610]|uniref:Aldehyde dehydrogenase domain-containing protein n=1 Tax=Sphaeroforma arctica JP610 TaxID=667725 RepID=A0A0L0G2B0_9EUKA|nr:hypothetical protein SARC_04468 [Sphaeroforma arctica JP610]KNC83272.1 hypothetical protein SARC_04468 [Sphaeroforma arctica JP610]|eukprot:XP_014157174.1 hypothetical protein SARC_04468 [Sphaeroforma arctica JP610]
MSFPLIDSQIEKLQANKKKWVNTSFADKVQMLKKSKELLHEHGLEWAKAAMKAKGYVDDHHDYEHLLGEEIFGMAQAQGKSLNYYIATFEPLAKQQASKKPYSVPGAYGGMTESIDGKSTVCKVFPSNITEKVVYGVLSGELWVEHVDLKAGQKPKQGSRALDRDYSGDVALVLGAGNQTAIQTGDVLYYLFNMQDVVLLKWNPVNDYGHKFFEMVYAPFIEAGVVCSITGGVDVGKYLTSHPSLNKMHMTGSGATHDQIVWGPGDAETIKRNKQAGKKSCDKEFCSELGCVSPVLVTPGEWSKAEMDNQVQHLAGTVAHNNSFNCVASKVFVVDSKWAQKEEFLAGLKKALASAPTRNPYYPNSHKRHAEIVDHYGNRAAVVGQTKKSADHLETTLVANLKSSAVAQDEKALVWESWTPFAAVLEMDQTDGSVKDFLNQSVAFCNERLYGTLGATIVIDPKSEADNKQVFEKGIANLNYGTVAVNAWTGIVFITPNMVWGGAPGATAEDVQSGVGWVHNSMLYDEVHKSVFRAPFRMPLGLKLPWNPTVENLRAYAQVGADVETQGGVVNMLKFLKQTVSSCT